MKKDFVDLESFTKEEIVSILDLADDITKNPQKYSQKMRNKTLLMIFDKASLRTRVSFEAGMTQMGGHAIYYDVATSPLGKKETMSDTAKTASRYVDIIMARIGSHDDLINLALNSSVPVINAMTNFAHPCQILADLRTIREKKSSFKDLKLTYLGDSNNNVTHSLLFGCAIMGININIGCPRDKRYEPQEKVVTKARSIAQKSGTKIKVIHDAKKAVEDADIVYTDSWMSYHIPKSKMKERIKILNPYQVNKKIMGYAKPNAIFMNCLPAMRGMEQTAEVIDGKQSVVFDQAENRLYTEKALILKLLNIN